MLIIMVESGVPMSIRWPDRESHWHELDPSAWRNRLSGLFVSVNMLFEKEYFTKS